MRNGVYRGTSLIGNGVYRGTSLIRNALQVPEALQIEIVGTSNAPPPLRLSLSLCEVLQVMSLRVVKEVVKALLKVVKALSRNRSDPEGGAVSYERGTPVNPQL